VSGVIAMSANAKDALDREKGLLPVEGSGGSIMNATVLKQARSVIKERAAEFKDMFRIFSIDTSAARYAGHPGPTAEAVAKKILDWIADCIEEKILSAPKSAFPSLQGTVVLRQDDAREMIEKFEAVGNFSPRKKVEADLNRLQPLPIVVVRNKSGDILRLIRRERDRNNVLDSTITVWAGGHVRREDGPSGTGSIMAGAMRELEEELRIYANSLELIGAVYIPKEGSTKKHVAFVYEWRAVTDDVEVALCNSEFIEKAGTSLSGNFLPPEEIVQEQKLEDWSREILNNLFLEKPASKVAATA
jgi:predicted NUDIX family phosphoesterase